jgi:bacterioferritin-associated ferredoxin
MLMDLDEELCLCFHVTKRKVLNYLRVEKPRRAGQLSDCFGAGTGCGWCRPFLRQLFQQHRGDAADTSLPTAAEYAALRARYVRQGGGTPPPGATPLPGDDPLGAPPGELPDRPHTQQEHGEQDRQDEQEEHPT